MKSLYLNRDGSLRVEEPHYRAKGKIMSVVEMIRLDSTRSNCLCCDPAEYTELVPFEKIGYRLCYENEAFFVYEEL